MQRIAHKADAATNGKRCRRAIMWRSFVICIHLLGRTYCRPCMRYARLRPKRRLSNDEGPMTDKNTASAVVPLLPVELGPGKIRFAQGMKAGRWVFATGVMAQDFKSGIASEALAENAQHSGAPKREKEALRIFENIDAVLTAAGTDRASLVRTDQYYTTVKAVPPYQQVRRQI